MTYEHYSAEWLAAHCDSDSAFERAVKRQLARLLEENEDYRRTCEHLLRQTCEQIGEIVALKEQRDELLAALRKLHHGLDECDMVHDDQRSAYANASAIIAKATGETK